MVFSFQKIGIVGYFKKFSIYKVLYFWLKKRGYNIIIERKIANFLKLRKVEIGNLDFIGKNSDIIIAIGGDGNILRVGRKLAKYNIKIIGINQGHLGFLTDITPNFAIQELSKILNGKFLNEKRFLLDIKIIRKNTCCNFNYAINEIILSSGKVARMIEFEVYINNILSFFQRSDGLIVSTPTGSTAYSLSIGGPIVSPLVNAIILAPIFPHSLSSRPLIINGNSIIRIKILKFSVKIKIICDGSVYLKIQKGEEIIIRRSNHYFDLIHPSNYNYFSVLTRKLGWLKKLF